MKPRTPGFWLIVATVGLLALLPIQAFAGMTPEEVKVFEGYKAKAEKGDPAGQYSLGFCYANGDGVAQDKAESVKWFRKAADQGFAEAQSNLGMCYDDGTGVARDYVEAYAFYKLAEKTNEEAGKRLATLEKFLSHEATLRGQKRSKEIQKEIDANIAAKKAGK